MEKAHQNLKLSAEEIRVQIYSKMSPAQKWREACKIREAAWKLKAAGIRAQHPEWSDSEIENTVKHIFLYATT